MKPEWRKGGDGGRVIVVCFDYYEVCFTGLSMEYSVFLLRYHITLYHIIIFFPLGLLCYLQLFLGCGLCFIVLRKSSHMVASDVCESLW